MLSNHIFMDIDTQRIHLCRQHHICPCWKPLYSLVQSYLDTHLGGYGRQHIPSCHIIHTHNVLQTDNVSESDGEVLIVVPFTVVDAALLWWIFLSLTNTVKVLTIRFAAVAVVGTLYLFKSCFVHSSQLLQSRLNFQSWLFVFTIVWLLHSKSHYTELHQYSIPTHSYYIYMTSQSITSQRNITWHNIASNSMTTDATQSSSKCMPLSAAFSYSSFAVCHHMSSLLPRLITSSLHHFLFDLFLTFYLALPVTWSMEVWLLLFSNSHSLISIESSHNIACMIMIHSYSFFCFFLPCAFQRMCCSAYGLSTMRALMIQWRLNLTGISTGMCVRSCSSMSDIVVTKCECQYLRGCAIVWFHVRKCECGSKCESL